MKTIWRKRTKKKSKRKNPRKLECPERDCLLASRSFFKTSDTRKLTSSFEKGKDRRKRDPNLLFNSSYQKKNKSKSMKRKESQFS